MTTKIYILIAFMCAALANSASGQNAIENTDSLRHVNDSLENEKLQFFMRQAIRLQRENDSLKALRDNNEIKNAQHYLKKEKIKIDTNEFVYKGNVYKRKSGYLTLGAGPAFNLKPLTYKNPIIGVGLTFRLKNNYLRTNYSNIRFDANKLYRNQYFNVALGSTQQKLKSVISYYFGLSYSFLWRPTKINGMIIPDTYSRIGSYGVYAEFSYYYKPLYDIGVGPTVFVNLDFINPIAGIRFDLYFANSFKHKQ